jgi:solute carrier family 35 protein E1
MKLSITLTLAALSSSACSAFALSPHHAVRSITNNIQPPAFVRQPDIKSRDVSLPAAANSEAINTRGGGTVSIDIPLLTFFGLWYLGNYYYNVSNKLALKAAGGATGFPLTISALQLGIGSLYGIFLWLAPDARKAPTITMDDVSLPCCLFGFLLLCSCACLRWILIDLDFDSYYILFDVDLH